MQFDFWNNPLVVSAMRLKYRRSSPGLTASGWMLALLGVGAFVHYLSQENDFRFPSAYLLAILGLQFLLSAGIAVTSTSSSMNAEVLNRTLDFQRIVTLSPQSILIGKMLGEPAISYLLAIASIPLAVLCWALGAASAGVIFWLYVNLATSTLMWASVGLIHSLTPPTQTPGRARSGGSGIGAIALLFMVLPQMLIHGARSLDAPGIGEIVQLLTPIGSLIHLWEDSAWNAHVTFWSLSLPSLVIAPVAELTVAVWIVAAMSRRLKNSIDPAITKRCSYATIGVLDLAVAGICFAQWRAGVDASHLLYGYCLAHVVICLLIALVAVPRRGALLSSLWRAGQGESTVQLLLWGERSEMSLAAVVFGLIGLAVLAVGLILPMNLATSAVSPAIQPQRLVEVAAVTLILVTALVMTQQLFLAAGARGGQMLFILFLLLTNLLPPVIGAVLRESEINADEQVTDAIASLSPVAFYVMNLSRYSSTFLGPGWLLLVYSGLAVISYALLQRLLRQQRSIVGAKLQTMGLAPMS